MKTYFDKISSLILEFTDLYYKKIILNIIDSGEYTTEPKRFFYTIILKSNSALQATSILIRDFHTQNHYHPSIYILLRSILADIIVAEYIISLGKNDQKIKDAIHSINLDHIERLIHMLNNYYSKHNIISPTEIEEIKQDLITNKKQYVDDECNLKGKALKTSPQKLTSLIFGQCPKEYDKKLLICAFEYYETFSKYEHIGGFSFYLLHKGFEKDNLGSAFNEVFQSLNVILSALLNYTNLWDFDKTDVAERLNSIFFEIKKLTPNTIPKA